jgi:hypothetical protein
VSMDRRLGKGDHPSQQINVEALRNRLRAERLAAAGIDLSGAVREPTRLSHAPGAYRHLVAVAMLFVLLLGTLGVAVIATAARDDSGSRGWIRSCVSCHTRIVEQPSVAAS